MSTQGRQATTEIKVTPEMVAAGVRAYEAEAAHDEWSFSSKEELVSSILRAALSRE